MSSWKGLAQVSACFALSKLAVFERTGSGGCFFIVPLDGFRVWSRFAYGCNTCSRGFLERGGFSENCSGHLVFLTKVSIRTCVAQKHTSRAPFRFCTWGYLSHATSSPPSRCSLLPGPFRRIHPRQCACRLAALYLDQFPASCHRLGMPLTAIAATRTTADESRSGRSSPQTSLAGSVKAVDAPGPSGFSRAAATAAAIVATPSSSNENVGMLDGADAGGSSSVAPGEKGIVGVGGTSGAGAAGSGDSSASSATPATATNTGAMAMDVDQPRPPHDDGDLPPSGVNADGGFKLATDISGDPPVADNALAPHAAQDSSVPGSAGGGMELEEVAKATTPAASSASPAANRSSAAPQSTSLSSTEKGEGSSGGSGSSSGGGSSSDSNHLGKGQCSTVYTDLTIETGGDGVPVENDGSDNTLKRRRREGNEPSESPEKAAEKKTSPAAVQVLGLRGVPGPDLTPFFRGTALPARKDGSGKGGGRDGGKLSAIAVGLRRMGTAGARTAGEASAAEAMANRFSIGNATQEVRCLLCMSKAFIYFLSRTDAHELYYIRVHEREREMECGLTNGVGWQR